MDAHVSSADEGQEPPDTYRMGLDRLERVDDAGPPRQSERRGPDVRPDVETESVRRNETEKVSEGTISRIHRRRDDAIEREAEEIQIESKDALERPTQSVLHDERQPGLSLEVGRGPRTDGTPAPPGEGLLIRPMGPQSPN